MDLQQNHQAAALMTAADQCKDLVVPRLSLDVVNQQENLIKVKDVQEKMFSYSSYITHTKTLSCTL